MFQSDGSCEYDNSTFGAHFLKHGTYLRKSYPDTQAQNFIAECKHRYILEMVCAMLFEAKLPASF